MSPKFELTLMSTEDLYPSLIKKLNPNAYQDTYLGRPDENYKVNQIKKIISNGPATILITTYGKKVVVKAQDDNNDPIMGLYMVLLKYLVDSKRYSDLVVYIFEEGLTHAYAALLKAKCALIALMSYDTLEDIVEAFVMREFD